MRADRPARIALVPFERDHLRRIRPQAAQADTAERFVLELDAAALHGGVARSAELGGEIVGCAGVQLARPGIGFAWAVFGEAALLNPVSLVRACADGLRMAEREYGLRRIEATAACGHGAAARFLEALGFQHEGVLRNYGPNGSGDYVIFSRIKT